MAFRDYIWQLTICFTKLQTNYLRWVYSFENIYLISAKQRRDSKFGSLRGSPKANLIGKWVSERCLECVCWSLRFFGHLIPLSTPERPPFWGTPLSYTHTYTFLLFHCLFAILSPSQLVTESFSVSRNTRRAVQITVFDWKLRFWLDEAFSHWLVWNSLPSYPRKINSLHKCISPHFVWAFFLLPHFPTFFHHFFWKPPEWMK